MNIEPAHAFTYAFYDKGWSRKLGILLLISLVPGLNLIAWMGYQLSIAHNIARDLEDPLPGWEDWADILVRGLMGLLASLAYFMPVLLILALVSLLGGASTTRLCVGLGLVLYVGGAWVVLTAAHVRFVRTDQAGDYYQFGQRLRETLKDPATYGIGTLYLLVIAVAVLILMPLTAITLIGPFIVIAAASVANGYILGALAR